MMGKIKIIMLLCLTVLLGSCVKEDLIQGGNVTEGESAIVSVSLKGAQMGSGAKSRALTPEDEKKINNIHVLIFNNKDELVTNMHFDSYNSGIVVPTYSGNNRTIYVVANGDAHTNIDKDLIRVKQRSDLDAIVVENSVHDLQRTNGLIMAGEIKVDIIPGTSSLSNPIPLSYLSAKVTLKVIDNTPAGQSVQILGWDVIDASAKGFLNDKGTDAVNPDTPADFFTTDGKYQFETKNDVEKSATQEMYLFENRRGKRAERGLPDDPNKRYEDMGQNDNDHKGKAWYAPTKATYILIYAMHNQDASTKQIFAKIYIGADNNSDYNIARSNHYTFTVTVNGLNDINVDSNVDYAPGGLNVTHGTNLAMDTHYDFRPIRLQAANGVATIEILDDAGRAYNEVGFNATWLKISPINLMNVQIQQSGGDAYWQEIAGDHRFARAKYIPHKSERTALADKGGWNTVPSGLADDDVMSLADATYRMCYKITDINFTDVSIATPQILNIYADENVKPGIKRSAKVKIAYLKNGFSESTREVQILDITQEGILTIFNNTDMGLYQLDENGVPIDGTKKRFAIECCEEPALILNPGIGLNFQQTEIMQWGFSGINLYNGENKNRNGQFLTVKAVFNNGVTADASGLPIWDGSSSDYRDLYGNSGAVIPPYSGTGQQGPYFLPVPDKNKVYHPIFNSSAARYCFEKNRDRNGDGKIDQSEAVWYLPSRDEMLMILVANSEDIDNTFPSIGYGMFWTSTQRTPYKEIVKGKPTDRLLYDTYAVGPAFGFAPSTGGDSPFRVRCIRNIPLP